MGVLITGGMGVLGSMVTEELVSRGERVVLYARHFDRSLLAPDVLGAVEFVRGDVLDLPNVVHAIRRHRTDRILHMAALLIGECQENPYLGFRVNAGGAVNVYEAARMTDVGRVVYTSSKSVYGAVAPPYGHPTYAPLPEEGWKDAPHCGITMKLKANSLRWGFGFVLIAMALSVRAADKVDFVKEVKPLLETTCLSCHGGPTGATATGRRPA